MNVCNDPQSIATSLEEFINPPRSCSQIPFWFLNGPVDGPEYARQIGEMARQGVYQAMPHPRFGMDRRDYLSPRYWEAFDELIAAAKKGDFTIHLYDEYNWSSGPAGGRVTADRTSCALGLGMRQAVIDGPGVARVDGWDVGLMGWGSREDYVSVVVAPAGGADDGPDLSRAVNHRPPASSLPVVEVEVPAGRWHVMVFYTIRTLHPSALRMGNGGIIDYLSAEATNRFIATTHEEYARRFGKHFGTLIPSIFYDECGPYASGPFTWTGDFAEQFRRRTGYDIVPRLIELFHDGGARTEKTRCDYWDTVAHLFAERFIGQMADWCVRNGLALTGHSFEESSAWPVSADLMRTLRRQQWVGMDALNGPLPFSWMGVPASVASLTGCPLVCEAAGLLGGWGCSPRLLRRAYHRLAVAGVTHLVPHAFFQTIDNAKVECPPSFFEHNPYWRYYRQLADLTARQCWMNRQGKATTDVFVLHPLVSWWGDGRGGRGYGFPWGNPAWRENPSRPACEAFDELLDTLAANQWQATVLDDEALATARVDGAALRAGPLSSRVLILPPMRTIRRSSLHRIVEFATQGVCIISMGPLPAISMEAGRDDPEMPLLLQSLQEHVRQPKQPRDLLALLPDLTEPAARVIGDNTDVHVSRRLLADGSNVYLIVNARDEIRRVRVRLCGQGQASLWNPETAAITPLDATAHAPDQAEVALTLGADAAVYVCLGPTASEKPAHSSAALHRVVVPLEGPWEMRVVSDDAQLLPRDEVGPGIVKLPVFRSIAVHPEPRDNAVFNWKDWPRNDYDDQSWPLVHCARGPVLFDGAGSQLFRAVIPPGAFAIRRPLPIAGEFALYADGELLQKELGHQSAQVGRLQLPRPSDGRSVLAIECASMAPGFGLTGPIEFLCRPVVTPLGSWTDQGLGWLSGRVLYRTTFDIHRLGSSVWIDLGDVRECAEVQVNGHLAGARIWPPYRIEITPLVREGLNELCVIVSNTLSNRMSWDVLGTRGGGHELPSGLLGPAFIEMFSEPAK